MIARIERGRQHADAERRPAEERHAPHPLGRGDLELAHERHQHEDAPEAVDDRRNRGQQLGQEHQRPAQPLRRELRDEDGDAERDRRRDEQRQDRRIQRAPDERPRAELAGHRIPGLGLPELPAELPDRQPRLAVELDADRDHDHDQRARRTRPSRRGTGSRRNGRRIVGTPSTAP